VRPIDLSSSPRHFAASFECTAQSVECFPFGVLAAAGKGSGDGD
jgi:hypothetical protein